MSLLQVNHVCVAGNLIREPVHNQLPSGENCIEFSLAISPGHISANTRSNMHTCDVDIIARGQLARMVVAHFRQDGEVVVDGSLVSEYRQVGNGEIQPRLMIAAESVYFIGDQAGRSLARNEDKRIAPLP